MEALSANVRANNTRASPPAMRPIYTSQVNPSLAALDWHKFLACPRLDQPPPEALDSVRLKRILATGAGGSIGTALGLRLAQPGTSHLALLETSESNPFALQHTLLGAGPGTTKSCVLGSIANAEFNLSLAALRSACDQRDIAALETLRIIVPECTPRTAILALAASSALRVAP
jgi:FlaA1/EpsC-like NDP-sugar epimerase